LGFHLLAELGDGARLQEDDLVRGAQFAW
jgi:hypothetical protein